MGKDQTPSVLDRIANSAALKHTSEAKKGGRTKMPIDKTRTYRATLNVTEEMKNEINLKKGVMSESAFILNILKNAGVIS